MFGTVASLSRPVVASRRARKLNGEGQTRLHVAARRNRVSDVVTLLLEGADINATDYAGLPCFHPLTAVYIREQTLKLITSGRVNGDAVCPWESANFDLPTEWTPLNRSPQNLSQVITSATRTSVTNWCKFVLGFLSRPMKYNRNFYLFVSVL